MEKIDRILELVSPKPVLQVVWQAAVVYLFLLIVIRLAGKRSIGQASPLDFIIAPAIGDVIDEITYGSEPLVNGFAIIFVWLILHESIAFNENRGTRVRKLVFGQKTLIIQNGRLLQKELLKERVSEEEVRQLLREISIDGHFQNQARLSGR